ncbi:hypothetical protein J3D46_003051 [Paenarthrobacter sp. A20]|nr:hypothetical protein [Paenarthrobacter sp. A20]
MKPTDNQISSISSQKEWSVFDVSKNYRGVAHGHVPIIHLQEGTP